MVRPDPYRNFNFVVSCDGRPVAGISSVSGLARSTEPIEHREGADPVTTRVSPGSTPMAPVTLQRGVTHDAAFASWASSNATNNLFVRKDLYIALYNEAGQKVAAYNLYRCWPSEFEAMGGLDTNGTVIQRMVLQLEGWEQDTTVTEPTPATYSDSSPAS
ncbi:MAG TPA: phage tail protein [Longimicrobium sp.]|nr:phage tail protein [Longimicrobium sp.]